MAPLVLPSPVGGVTTETVGLFDVPARTLAEWFRAGDPSLVLHSPGWDELEDATGDLAPTAVLTTRAFVPLRTWTVLLTNGPLGTDVGLLPSHATRALDCISIRAVCADRSRHPYPAVVLEVYAPDGKEPLKVRRTIAAANDGGRWVFEQTGEPFGFEHVDCYTVRRKADRFTPAMLHEYLGSLGVPLDTDPEWAGALTVVG